MNSNPAITVLMPAYNCGPYVGEAIESILGQTFRDFELLIINDGSTDDTREVILSFQDPRIRFLDNGRNLGAANSSNIGMGRARGAYIARMDADDLSLPSRLERQYEFMEGNPQTVACGTGLEFFSDEPLDRSWPMRNDPERLKVDLFFHSPLIHGSLMFRRSPLRRHGIQYDPRCVVAQDYDFISRLARVGDLGAVEEILYRYRRYADQATVKRQVEQGRTSRHIRARLLKELGLEFTPQELEVHNLLAVHHFTELGGRVDEAERWLAKLYSALTDVGGHSPDKVRAALWNYCLLLCLSLPPRRGLACLARIFRPPLSAVFPWQNMSPYKMLLYYSYRKFVRT
ncbi:glycosyltransferase family 2 protein [Desulfoferula mesophila]|uniref:Glycosyltransferase 2-like domain-containing protein n=1 Tax=Desulfoferula mesophila TaxID=3058419 RepID=A0AAU9EFW6_9BACT|nr:hypothetical protein FAK_27560 [Desulfoferula mesophilus]